MADNTRIIIFSSTYLLFYFAFMSIIGLTTFPPPPSVLTVNIFGVDLFTVTLSFWDFTALLFIIALILGISIIAGISILGSGLRIDQKFFVTIIVGVFVALWLGYLIASMFVDVPFIVSALFTYPFIIAIVYSVVSMAGGKG